MMSWQYSYLKRSDIKFGYAPAWLNLVYMQFPVKYWPIQGLFYLYKGGFQQWLKRNSNSRIPRRRKSSL